MPKRPTVHGSERFESRAVVPLFTSPVSFDETLELLTHVMSTPELFDAATQAVHPDVLRECGDDEVYLLFAGCHRLAEAGTRPGMPTFVNGIKDFLQDVARMLTDGLYAEAAERLLADEGFFERAATASSAHCDPERGFHLLRRFIEHHTVLAPLRKAFVGNDGFHIDNLKALLQDANQRMGRLDALRVENVVPVGDQWDGHEQRLQRFRRGQFAGLRTGLAELDRRTLGLRGLFLLGAMPGVGKTSLTCIEIPLGICRHHTDNDAVVIVISLEMYRDELLSRLRCNLGKMDWSTLTFGSPAPARIGDSMFSVEDQKKLDTARERACKDQVDGRLAILDREFLGENVTAERLTRLVTTMKERAGAKRALIVIDYLQLLPVPDAVADRGDLETDRYRVRMLQQLMEGCQTADSPDGVTILAISEARKPPRANDAWGQSLSELMGSSRLPYAANGVLLYRRMNGKEIEKHYGVGKEQVATQQMRLDRSGIAPIIITLEKGRDGMTRGSWPAQFHFRQSRFVELGNSPVEPPCDPPPPRGPRTAAVSDVRLPNAKLAAAAATLPPVPVSRVAGKHTQTRKTSPRKRAVSNGG